LNTVFSDFSEELFAKILQTKRKTTSLEAIKEKNQFSYLYNFLKKDLGVKYCCY